MLYLTINHSHSHRSYKQSSLDFLNEEMMWSVSYHQLEYMLSRT